MIKVNRKNNKHKYKLSDGNHVNFTFSIEHNEKIFSAKDNEESLKFGFIN